MNRFGEPKNRFSRTRAALSTGGGAKSKFLSICYALVILMLAGPLVAAETTPQRFNVQAFGAVGDGIADDQPALTRAAKAVAQNKGGVLYLPFGVYRCGR